MVNKRLPEKILITENGVRPHSNPRWTGAIQPVIMKAGFDESYDDQYGGPKAEEEAALTNDVTEEGQPAEVLPITTDATDAAAAEQNVSPEQGGSANQDDHSSNASDASDKEDD